MFDELRFRYLRMRLFMTSEPAIRKARLLRDRQTVNDLIAERSYNLDLLENEKDRRYGWKLIRRAERLDIEPPDRNDKESWVKPEGFGWSLTTPARAKLRQLIDAENVRRRETKAWWWKNVIIPALSALTGLAGVITGMIAVLHSHK